jgi:hypothetical protein
LGTPPIGARQSIIEADETSSGLWGSISSSREPFFDDDDGDTWRVIARPGSRDPLSGLRDDDLVVRRGQGRRGGRGHTISVPVADVDLRSLRGPDGTLRDGTLVLRRERSESRARQAGGGLAELVEVCGFFGPNNVRRTEQEVRDAVVDRAESEWTAWSNGAGGRRTEGEAGMFGRLLGYYLSAGGSTLPDTLTALLATALTTNYAALLAGGAAAAELPATLAAVTAVRQALLVGAPGALAASLSDRINAAIRHARQAHFNSGDFAAWSAAFVVTCVRGAGIAQGLEAVLSPGRQHVGRDALLLGSLTHAGYTIEARTRRAATNPRRREATSSSRIGARR